MAKGIWIVCAAIVLAGVAFFVWNGTPVEAPASLQESLAHGIVRVSLTAQNSSGETGFAELSDAEGGKTSVRIGLNDWSEGAAQPAHIHGGMCPAPGAVKYPLSPVTGGVSETVLDVPLVSLLADLPLAVNVHKSAQEISVYAACGDLWVPQGEMLESVSEAGDVPETIAEPPGGMTGSVEVSGGIMAEPVTVYTVRVTGNGFEPARIAVRRGDSVTWVNESGRDVWPASAVHPTHTVYPTTGGCLGSTFDACRGLATGGSWSFVFDEAGTWGYHDHLRASVTGTVVVE